MKAWRADGAGNRFLLLDLRDEASPAIRAFAAAAHLAGALAREECSRAELDGLLLLLAPTRANPGGNRGANHVARFVVWNRDGSAAGACGNGLRCAARLLFDERFAGAQASRAATARDSGRPVEPEPEPEIELTIEVENGTRRLRATAPGPARAPDTQVEIGAARLAPPRRIVVADEPLTLFPVDVGNPHAVLFVRAAGTGVVSAPPWWRAMARVSPAEFLASERIAARIRATGAALQAHFLGGVNVGFCRVEARGLALRVFERGVGETRACGTGSTAAAAVAHALGLASLPIEVRQPGGMLHIESERAVASWGTPLWLGGDVRLTPLAAGEQMRLDGLVRGYVPIEDATVRRTS